MLRKNNLLILILVLMFLIPLSLNVIYAESFISGVNSNGQELIISLSIGEQDDGLEDVVVKYDGSKELVKIKNGQIKILPPNNNVKVEIFKTDESMIGFFNFKKEFFPELFDENEDMNEEEDEENEEELPFFQIISYPEEVEVFKEQETIYVDVNEQTLTDVYINGNKIYTEADYKLADKGFKIPLSKGINKVEIISYDNFDNKESFISTIHFNEPFGFNILDEELLTNELAKPEIKVSNAVRIQFQRNYGVRAYETNQVKIRGKAHNADTLKVNNKDIILAPDKTFEFILKLKEGENKITFEAANEESFDKKILLLRYNKPKNIINVDDLEDAEDLKEGIKTNELTKEDDDIVYHNKFDSYKNEDTNMSQSFYFFLLVFFTISIIILIILHFNNKNNFNNNDFDDNEELDVEVGENESDIVEDTDIKDKSFNENKDEVSIDNNKNKNK